MPVIDLKILDPRIADNMPAYSTPGSAGMDMRACIGEPLVLQPGESKLVSTGVSIHIGDPSFVATLVPRSGLGAKHGLVLGNLVGIIDADYSGPLMACLWNRSSVAYTVQPMERVAQLLILPVAHAEFRIVDEHHTSERGEAGFGSTGKH